MCSGIIPAFLVVAPPTLAHDHLAWLTSRVRNTTPALRKARTAIQIFMADQRASMTEQCKAQLS